jgi:hypothetical protein
MIRNLFWTVDGLQLTGDVLLNFGRPPKWNCPIPETDPAAAARPSSDQQASAHAPEPQLRSSADSTVRNRTRATYNAQATPAPAPKTDAWEIPAIQCYEPEDGIFYAQMGPTGGKRGYPAITGSWHCTPFVIRRRRTVLEFIFERLIDWSKDSPTDDFTHLRTQLEPKRLIGSVHRTSDLPTEELNDSLTDWQTNKHKRLSCWKIE